MSDYMAGFLAGRGEASANPEAGEENWRSVGDEMECRYDDLNAARQQESEGVVVEIVRSTAEGPPMYSIVVDKREFGQFSHLLGIDLSNLKRGESVPFRLTRIPGDTHE